MELNTRNVIAFLAFCLLALVFLISFVTPIIWSALGVTP